MSNVYVMADIHGEYNMFISMLDKINFSKKDRLIVLGDVIDRGKNPIKTLQYIKNQSNIEMIMGNHERMFLDYILAKDKVGKYNSYHLFIQNGGYNTLKEYDSLSELEQEEIVKHLKSLPLYKIVDKFVLVHSGVNITGIRRETNIEKIMEKQDEEDMLWSREEFYLDEGIKGYTVIFGHTPTIFLNKDNFYIWYDNIYNNKIGIDCGATFNDRGGMLGCIRLNDMKEFYIKEE